MTLDFSLRPARLVCRRAQQGLDVEAGIELTQSADFLCSSAMTFNPLVDAG